MIELEPMDRQVSDLLERVRQFAMPHARPECRETWMRQYGEMRFSPTSLWMPFVAEEWFEGTGIDFRWRAWVTMAGFVRTRITDSFTEGRGALTASVFGVVPVMRSRGAAIDKGEGLRGLAELPWRPFSFAQTGRLSWQASAPGKLRGSYTDGATKATAEFEIDAGARILSCSAVRPRISGKSIIDTPWLGQFAAYREFDGMRIPTEAEVSWQLPEGPFSYWRARITEFRTQAPRVKPR